MKNSNFGLVLILIGYGLALPFDNDSLEKAIENLDDSIILQEHGHSVEEAHGHSIEEENGHSFEVYF